MITDMLQSMSLADKQILLVEDEALLAMEKRFLLEQHGLNVTVACNALEALSVIRENRIELVLMDIDLGDDKINGLKLAEIILKEDDIPIIFLSSHTEPEVIKKTKRFSIHDYIEKKSDISEILYSIYKVFKFQPS